MSRLDVHDQGCPVIISVSYGLGEGYARLRDDVQEWCDKNLNKYNKVRVYHCLGSDAWFYQLQFYDDRDAILFKTRWL